MIFRRGLPKPTPRFFPAGFFPAGNGVATVGRSLQRRRGLRSWHLRLDGRGLVLLRLSEYLDLKMQLLGG